MNGQTNVPKWVKPPLREFLLNVELRGFVTYHALNEALPSEVLDASALEEVLDWLSQNGVRLVEYD